MTVQLQTHDAVKTRAYLRYREFPHKFGQIQESVMLPTMEYLVLYYVVKNNTYTVVAYGVDELLPVIMLEEGITPRCVDYALAYHANILYSPADPTLFELV